MAGIGGYRPGSGRKKGSSTVKKVDPKVLNAGILPLEMILRVARKMWADAVDKAGEISDLAKAKEAATFAEPALAFTSAKLQSIAVTGANGGPIQHQHAVLDEVKAIMAQEAGKTG